VTNPDRTHRNPNLLVWQRRPWLIDHGAALYVHHNWAGLTREKVRGPFPLIANHVLLTHGDRLEEIDDAAAAALNGDALRRVVGMIPDQLLTGPQYVGDARPEGQRQRYLDYLGTRLLPPRDFVSAAAKTTTGCAASPPPQPAGR
jgi:hypothetical protein